MTLANNLINQDTGEIDMIAVGECALLLASRNWGGPNPPAHYQRNAMDWCLDRARSMRTAWRDQRGLPRDEPTSLIDVPTWGSSGDSFRKDQ